MVRRVLGAMALGLSTLRCSGPDSKLPPAFRRLKVPEERLESAEARERGRVLYRNHCALCHGIAADGRGVRREGFIRPPRDFTSAEWRQSTTPRRVFYNLREGVRGTAMPAWRAALDDHDLWDLTAYVLSVSRSGP
jgi:mono/diheme cytochrome c family protein